MEGSLHSTSAKTTFVVRRYFPLLQAALFFEWFPAVLLLRNEKMPQSPAHNVLGNFTCLIGSH